MAAVFLLSVNMKGEFFAMKSNNRKENIMINRVGKRCLTLCLALIMMVSSVSIPVYASVPQQTMIETPEENKEQADPEILEIQEEKGNAAPTNKDGLTLEESNQNGISGESDTGENETGEGDTGESEKYSITIESTEHAQVVSETEAVSGEQVTVTVTLDKGYEVSSFVIALEDGTEIEYTSKAGETEGNILYTFTMPEGAVTVTVEMKEIQLEGIKVTGEGEYIQFAFDQEKYKPGDTVTAILTPEPGYDLDLESIKVTEGSAEIEYQTEGPDEDGTITVYFTAAETDMVIMAGVIAKPRHSVTVTTQALGTDASIFETSVDPTDLYQGLTVQVLVNYTGSQIWNATVTYGENSTDLDFSVSPSAITFIMPDADVEVVISERESQDMGDLSSEDGSITGDWQGNSSSTKKENEPDVELSKSARWTNIEDGYAELTITEKDTSAYSNLPVDYIIILDRTRTMSLSGMTWEQGSYPDIVNENSPCINPNHFYYKGGISLWLRDYYTGYDLNSGYWFDNLSGGASSWSKRHYNTSGYLISTDYANGCQDRLTMAKQAVFELMDKIEEENQKVPSGKNKSRVAFWSFADGTYYGAADSYRIRGLFNYTPWTENYNDVKQSVSSIKTYSGTYYTESLKEVLNMLVNRNNTDEKHKDIYTKVVFISDGLVGDSTANNGHSREEVQSLANQIKALPNTELFTIAMGMNSTSEGAKFLAQMATQKSDGTYTAAFWQNLSFSGGKGSALAETLLNINEKGGEIKAVNKVLTDQIETKYWEPIEVLRADGTASLDSDSGVLTWNVPEGAGTTYSCTIKLKLKDEYRYKLTEEAWYETNRDNPGAESDNTKAGATMSYTISGGIYNKEDRKTGVITPELKYGTVQFSGKKVWTVSGSQADSITVRLMRTLPSQSTAAQVNNTITNASRQWAFRFDVRVLPDGSTKPLIKYDELGRKINYEVTESVPNFYNQQESESSEKDGITTVNLKNEPYKIKVTLQKRDNKEGQPITGAGFAVYEWNSIDEEYQPYQGTDTAVTGGEEVWLVESDIGTYESPVWLYYRPQNEGKFRIIEENTPEGFFGDYKDKDPENGKNVYDIQINEENTGSTVKISNDLNGNFINQRVQGVLEIQKLDSDSKEPLGGAVFEIRLPDGNVVDTLTTGADGKATSKPLDIAIMQDGNYIEPITYTLVETALEGYLLAEPIEFNFTYEGEKNPVVKVQLDVLDEMVMGILKVAKMDNETLEPVTGMEKEEEQAVFEILNENKEVVNTFQIGSDGYGTSGELPIALYQNGIYQRPRTYYLREKKAPSGYLPDTELHEFSFEYVDGITPQVFFELKIDNQPNDVNLEVEKSTIELTQEKEIYKYTIDKVRNSGNCRVDNFTLTDELPEEVTLQTLYTGTFEGIYQSENYSLWYSTNLHPEYRLWKDELSVNDFERLSVSDLHLQEGEEIRLFQYRFGTVEKTFKEIDPPVYLVQAKEKLSQEGIIENTVKLTGHKLGVDYETESKTYTRIIKYGVITIRPPEGPKNPSWKIIYDRYALDKDGKLIKVGSVQTSDTEVLYWGIAALVSVMTIGGIIFYKKHKKREKENQ